VLGEIFFYPLGISAKKEINMSIFDDYVIQTRGLSKSFGEVQALKLVDLSVPRNSIFGFLGPNGAGKTTMMKILLDLARPTSGGGTIFGYDIVRESVSIREKIGYLPQQPRFIDHMSARELLHFTAKFFFNGPEEKIEDRVSEMLTLVGLEGKADRPIRGFSGGEKQRLGIGLAQINYPELLILDEPAAALDPLGRHQVLEVMERLRKHTTIFYSTHILDDVQSVSDTVAILKQGELVAQGPIEQLLNGKDGIVYTLTVRGYPETLQSMLQSLPWVTNVKGTPRNGVSDWQIRVSNQEVAETQLLRQILTNHRVVVTDFNRKKYELEEIFIDLVKGNRNDR
jgi:ABC-2 type transport system ATP-binding protein